MSLKAVYIPKGKAREYGEYALNIYEGCPHGCYYCYAPRTFHKMPEDFHIGAAPYKSIVERAVKDAESGALAGKTVHLCFGCDPYPAGTDTLPTRAIIRALKSGGAHVQILTKNGTAARRDFDLLDSGDRFGVTLTMFSRVASFRVEPKAEAPADRINALYYAKKEGISTWVSFEPVISEDDTIHLLEYIISQKLADEVKIGKLNYFKPLAPIDWRAFGRRVERICKEAGQAYCIKDGLRAEMEKK